MLLFYFVNVSAPIIIIIIIIFISFLLNMMLLFFFSKRKHYILHLKRTLPIFLLNKFILFYLQNVIHHSPKPYYIPIMFYAKILSFQKTLTQKAKFISTRLCRFHGSDLVQAITFCFNFQPKLLQNYTNQ